MDVTSSLRWWQKGSIYQLLVPSFVDTDGDGFGDLPGVISRLDYIKWFGASAIWLSPIFRSPLRDLGYDVTDFTDVEPRFGSLEIFDELVTEAHRRDLRILLDWIPNHTSSDHEWFVESRASRENPKRDWYIWRDAGADSAEPNNWISVFGGSVWQWDPHTEQYYLHTFLSAQPDLNWRHPEVRTAMTETLRFWLERGVDGFRIDAMCLLLKDPQFRDNPPNPDFTPGEGPDSRLRAKYTRDQPGLHEIAAELREVVDEYGDDRILLGEFYLPIKRLVAYYGHDRPELHLPLNLSPTWLAWDAETLAEGIQHYQRQVPANGWPTTTLSTHDASRIAARAPGQARVAAMLLLTQRGTPTHYYGEELGMRGVPIPSQCAQDPQGRRTGRNRDPERSPMQWNAGPSAGFTNGEPWLPIGKDVQTANVAAQSADSRSLLALYRRLLALRDERPVLIEGVHRRIVRDVPLLVYRRGAGEHALLVVLNLGSAPRKCRLDEPKSGVILLSTFLDRDSEECHETVAVRGNEGLIIAAR